MFQNLKNDFPASIVVFLVALPLCLGVALASGAPLLSGVISGIIGGIVVGFLSKSDTSVSGPAAGLAAVVLASIAQLGSFELFLTAVVIAGIIQLLMGLFKIGFIADYIPSNVIKGLLAAIGIILILKQIPHAIGFDLDPEDDFKFFQLDKENTFTELFKAFNYISPGAIIISIVSILILLYWDKLKLKQLKFIPASLFVVLFGVLLNFVFQSFLPQFAINQSHLVNIPKLDSSSLNSIFHFPILSSLGNYNVWVIAFTVAIIASLETLLNLEAVDKLDPHKRKSPPNRELIAQGVGNIVAGLFGGIPVTSVIVRSSVNIQSGNDTKASTILHGFFMLISILLLSPILNMIPLASLAAILLFTGYKLAKISLFKEMYNKGWEQFVPFIATIIAIVFTDLLIGVVVGLVISIFFLLRANYRNPFYKEDKLHHVGEIIKLDLSNEVSFLNKATLKETLWAIPENTKVIINASYSEFIDNDILELIEDFKNVIAVDKKIQLNIIGIKEKYVMSDHIQFIETIDKETQENLKPDQVLSLLKLGNERFVNGRDSNKNYLHQIDSLSTGQNPMAVLIGCIDSRTSPEIIFDSNLGDILSIRIAGNIISPEVIGSIEIAVGKLGVKLIVVKGHSNCGAVAYALKNLDEENMGTITSKIYRAVGQCGCADQDYNTLDSLQVEKIAQQNILNSLQDILSQSTYLKNKIDKKEIAIVSAYHNVSNGKVEFGELI